VSFQYSYIDTEEFTESGATELNLNVDSESFSSMVSNLGLRVYRPFALDADTDFVPELRVRWAHEFGDTDRNTPARFHDVTTGRATFEVEGAEIGRDVAIIGAGWTVVGDGNLSLSLGYDATLNEDVVGHTATLGVLIYW
jgi:outer membrane autotransporter protein